MPPTLQDIAVSHLQFDPDNPRLPGRIDGTDPNEVADFFLQECNLIELMMSIAEQGYFQGEPLLAVPSGNGNDFIVVEGNRRLASLKILSGEISPRSMERAVTKIIGEAKERPDVAPCLIFSHRDKILTYLGYRHITGIKEWDALAKARYLFQLREKIGGDDHQAAHRKLAKEIGSKSNAVAKILTGFGVLNFAKDEGILRDLSLDESDVPFSLLTTAIGWTSIAQFIGLADTGDVELKEIKREEVRELFQWAFYKIDGHKTRIGDSRNFSILARIVQYPHALDALRKGASLEEADILADGPVEAIRVNIQKAISAIEHAQLSISIADGLNESDLADASKLRKMALSLEGSIKANLTFDEE